MILLAIGLCFLIPVEAQITYDKSFDTGDTVIMILADSLVYEGVLLSDSFDNKRVVLFNGEQMNVPEKQIVKMNMWSNRTRRKEKLKTYPTLREQSQYPEFNRQVFTGNYIPLPSGSAYLSNTMLTTFSLRYAASDRVSVAVSAEAMSMLLFGDLRESVFSVSSKWTIPLNDRLFAGGSVNYLFNSNSWIEKGARDYGFGLIGLTFGDKGFNATANVGFMAREGQMMKLPVLNIGSILRMDHKHALVFEGALWPIQEGSGYTSVMSLGFRNHVRHMGLKMKKRDVSFGMVFLYAPIFIEGDIPVIPVFDITMALDKRALRRHKNK